MKQIHPESVVVESKWCVKEVDSFLLRLADAPNKERFLTDIASKPSFDEQIEAKIVDIMKANKLGYNVSAGSDEKDTIVTALRSTVVVFRDVQKYRERLVRDKVSLFKTPILVAIEKTQSVKAKREPKRPFTIEKAR